MIIESLRHCCSQLSHLSSCLAAKFCHNILRQYWMAPICLNSIQVRNRFYTLLDWPDTLDFRTQDLFFVSKSHHSHIVLKFRWNPFINNNWFRLWLLLYKSNVSMHTSGKKRIKPTWPWNWRGLLYQRYKDIRSPL